MKVTVTLLLTLVSILVGHALGEYRVKVYPPIPPPPLPPFKYSLSPLKGGGHRWSSNSLGPPRLHHHHLHHRPPGIVHHHVPHGPAISVHLHGGPSPQKAVLRPLHAPHQHLHHHLHAPLPQAPFSHPHPQPPPPPHPSALVHHHHHHHIPPAVTVRPSFKAPWNGPQGNGGGGGGAGFGPGKDTFHPSPPDGAQAIVATHQTVDDNKGPIHTIPAPNLGPSGKHPHPRPVITLGSLGGGGQGSGFQTGHGIGQGSGDAGGPYPNPVYGKPVTADLTYHEPMVTPEAQAQLNGQIPTITLQNSHSYQVHEHGVENLVTPAPIFTQVTTLSPSGAFYAPDPDPSLPAPKIPYTFDPHSHPSNGQSPADLEQEIPQHLLTLYGFNQPSQNVHLQPQVHVQEQHQVHHQLPNVAAPGEVLHQGGYVPADLGGQLILSQALAQFEVQSQPETYTPVTIHQQHTPQQQVQVIHDTGAAHHSQLLPAYVQTFDQFKNHTAVSVQQVPLVASSHETLHHTFNSPQAGSISNGQGGHFSAYDLFANSPVNSPVLDALKENFHPQYPTSTPAPLTLPVGNNHFQFQLPVSTTIAPPTSTPANNAVYGHQQFISTTVAPSVQPVVNNIEYQPQIQDFGQSAVSNGQSFSDLYHNLGTVALGGHQAQVVSVTNPGQAGYIAASYHSQQSGNAAAPQVQTHVYNYGQDSFSAETRQKTSSVEASEVNALANSVPTGITSGALRKGGVETVRPSSSSSFYSEKAVRVVNQHSKNEPPPTQQQEAEEDQEYYDEEVAQDVDSDDDKKSENPQPALPSSYGVYESYEGNGKDTGEENGQEYEDSEGQYEDYSTQTKNYQNEGSQTHLDEEKISIRKQPVRNYNHNVEYGTRLRPKKNN